MTYVGICVSAVVADLKNRLEELEVKAKGKFGSTRASAWIVQTGIVFY